MQNVIVQGFVRAWHFRLELCAAMGYVRVRADDRSPSGCLSFHFLSTAM